jgi:DNA-binding transcriptional LysR family regulator
MHLSQLEVFVALAELHSFTEAAERVGVTQSAVSHALAALERELSATLFERNRRGVTTLTAIGQSILPHVRALLANAEAITQEAKAARGLADGRLRLGNTLSLSPDLIARVVRSFQQLYPTIEVVLFEGTMLEVSEWIAHSIVDVGWVLLPHPESAAARGLASTLLVTDELCVLVPRGHRLEGLRAVGSQDLANEHFIMAKNACTLQLMGMAGLEPGRLRAQIRHQASDSATILAMVRETLGISLMPRSMLPPNAEGVVALPLRPPRQLPLGLAVRAQATIAPSTRRFIEMARTWVKNHVAGLPAS